MKNFLIFLIVIYQKTLSPDHGIFKARYPFGFCRFHPSCSQYTKEALTHYGIIKGTSLSLVRILRCNPWARGGVNTLPKKA